MANRVKHYDPGKVGEDIELYADFKDSRGNGLEISAAIISIKDAAGNYVVTDQPVEMVAAYRARYVFVPATSGQHTGEWHDLYGELDGFSANFVIDIEERIGVQGQFVAGPTNDAPLALQRLDLGVFTVPEASVAGQLVSITAAGVAETYATRAAGGPIAADAVIRSKISATTAWLSTLAIIDDLTGLTAGAPLYLDEDGAVTHTATATNGELHQCVGAAVSTTRAVFDIGDAYVLGRKVNALPVEFTIAAGTASLSALAGNIFSATNEVTAATLLTLADGQDGDCLTVHLVQDATGYAVTFAASGRTVVYMEGAVPTTPSKAIRCTCEYATVNGVAELRVSSSAGA